MATAKLNRIGTVFNFTVNAEILNTACVYSLPEIELGNVKWTVKFCKRAADGDANIQALGVYLVSVVENHSTDWFCDAQASFKLFQKNGRASNRVVKDLPRATFDNRNPCHGIKHFIDWDRFVQNHVYENEAKFEIEISTGALGRMSMGSRDVNQVAAKFHIVIEEASKLTDCYSPKAVLQGVRWNILCQKKDEHLGVFLYNDINDMDSNWSYKVDARFKLVSFDRNVLAVSERFTHEFGGNNWGFPKFLKWTDFVDKDKTYISGDKANLFVELSVDPAKPIWDLQGFSLTKKSVSLECCLCLDSFSSKKIFSKKCGHLFCKPCFDKSIEIRNVCAFCQTATSSADLHPIFF